MMFIERHRPIILRVYKQCKGGGIAPQSPINRIH